MTAPHPSDERVVAPDEMCPDESPAGGWRAMTRRQTHRFGSVVFAVIDFLVVIAPSVVLAANARQGGLPRSHGLDLVAASALIGAVHAVIVWNRLRDETRHAHRIGDVWISEFDSLVVLAFGATVLLVLVLGGFAEQHAVLVNNGWPVIVMWTAVQITAVVISEVSGRLVFRWLEQREPEPDDDCQDDCFKVNVGSDATTEHHPDMPTP